MTIKNDREKVHEIKEGNVILEIYKKVDERSGKVFFDFKTAREFTTESGETVRGQFCQQRDLRNLIIASARAMEWISEQHRSMRFEEQE